MKEKQGKMDFPYTYSVKEMGTLMSPHTIFLFGSFIQEKLKGSMLDAVSFDEEKITKVGCPFCKDGFLKLVKVEPQYSGGPRRVPSVMHHVGNRYEYVCSNPKCDGRFVGTYTWMYID